MLCGAKPSYLVTTSTQVGKSWESLGAQNIRRNLHHREQGLGHSASYCKAAVVIAISLRDRILIRPLGSRDTSRRLLNLANRWTFQVAHNLDVIIKIHPSTWKNTPLYTLLVNSTPAK